MNNQITTRVYFIGNIENKDVYLNKHNDADLSTADMYDASVKPSDQDMLIIKEQISIYRTRSTEITVQKRTIGEVFESLKGWGACLCSEQACKLIDLYMQANRKMHEDLAITAPEGHAVRWI
tara:strand:+ start:229 stop:594 length:366 start_codon:yes stop_codon:yes gene_type:complete